MVDIAREVLGEAGYTVEYVNVSWARALQLTREGQLDAVVGAFTTDAPDFVFPDTPRGAQPLRYLPTLTTAGYTTGWRRSITRSCWSSMGTPIPMSWTSTLRSIRPTRNESG